MTNADASIQVLYESATTRVVRERHPQGAVVCKEMRGPDAARRLRHETAVLARLTGSEYVVGLAPGAQAAGRLALQDHGGASLAERLRAGPCDVAGLLALAPSLAQCVAAIHRAGILHRDISPANIVLSETGVTLLIDFDLAIPDEQRAGLAAQEGIVGTLAYLAPEQTGRTGRGIDQRSDLYALGATLYEMATGRPPFEGTDPLQLIHDHLVREPVPPAQRDPRVPAGLSRIILRLLAKSPEQRYQSAQGLLHDLLRLRTELAEGQGGVFELGERDFPARLAPPARLVGRDAEVSVLQVAFAESLNGLRRTVLVEGAAGVGKSALIQELRPMAAATGGWLVRGKFDQYHKDAATVGALAQALRALGRLLLALPAQALEAERRRLVDGLGRNAGLITRFLPEFELLLGPQPPVDEPDPRQAEQRLQRAVVALLAAVVSTGRPLVMVLDDLQWAGGESLRLVEQLMTEPQLRGLLVVGSFRTQEADAIPGLAAMLARWSAQSPPPTHIVVGDLTAQGVGEMAGRMLRLAPEAAVALGQAVHALTGGNPFDTVETINALRTEGVLHLEKQGWQWEEQAVRRFVGRGNVVDLLAARVSRLPAAARELLACLGCLGNSADLRLLATASGLDDEGLNHGLRPALDDGLLVRHRLDAQENVQFRHDRVQHAVLSALPADRLARLHHEVARRLAAAPAFEGEAAQQYFACAAALAEPAERNRAAELLHGAARKLAMTASYAVAERYLAAATTLLAGARTPAAAALRGTVDAARHAALYSLARLDESDPLYAAMQERAGDPLDLVEPTCLQMRSLDMRGHMQGAMQLGLRLLAQLGLHVPADHADPRIEQRLDALRDWVARDSRLDHAARPQMRDARLLAIAKLLGRTVRSAVVCFDEQVMVWLLLESQRLWVEHGPCAELVASLGRMGNLLIGRREDYRGAYAICRHVLTVGEALGYETQTAEARFIHATYACHWVEPLEHMFRHATQAYEGIVSGSDVSYAGYVHIILSTAFWDLAANLDAADERMGAGLALCHRTGNLHAAIPHILIRQVIRALRGQTAAEDSFDDAQFSEAAFLQRAGPLPYVAKSHSECRAMHALVMGHRGALARATATATADMGNLAGYYLTAHLHFFTAMARAWQIQDGDGAASVLAELDRSLDWLAARAADQPANFGHLRCLVQAERAWAVGDLWKAAAGFDAALQEAESRARPWQRAVITERAGAFQLAQGLVHAGRRLLTHACEQYQAWGATAKVARMQQEHAFLRTALQASVAGPGAAATRFLPGSNSVSADALELMGVLRASQALSSETSLERLAVRVTQVLAALTGATKVLLLAWNDDRWMLLAPGSPESSISAEQAAEHGLLPLAAVAYAGRTGEALLLDDARRDDRFAGDPYFARQWDGSLLLVPITPQGGGRFMLLLENGQTRGAFNDQRLDAVKLIGGQLAVSLVNVQLYESLEQRVQARTRELEQMQAQLVSTARRAGRAEIANNVLHNVGNVLNSINVSAATVRRTIGNSRIEGLARAVDLLNENAGDLPRFLAEDARGPALTRYLNELVAALQLERQDALADLDRLAGSVEHITYVVANQQSHTGPSSVLETVRPEEVLEEAVRLSQETVRRGGATVVRDYGPLPAGALDKQRVLQILVNLISNAVQAVESLPRESREVTLAARMVPGEEGQRLRISVRDHGEGIAPDHLERIFSHGFTTRRNGHGFGLHSSSVAALEMGGKLTARSGGPGKGAELTLDFPLNGFDAP